MIDISITLWYNAKQYNYKLMIEVFYRFHMKCLLLHLSRVFYSPCYFTSSAYFLL